MFHFEYYNNNENKLVDHDESEIYAFFGKLVIHAELINVFNSNYDFETFKSIANKFRIKNITNKELFGDKLVNTKFHFHFNYNGDLIKLERYRWNGELEISKEFRNNELITQNIYYIEDFDPKYSKTVHIISTNDNINNSDENNNNIVEELYNYVHNIYKNDFNNKFNDFNKIVDIFQKNNINYVGSRINDRRHAYSIKINKDCDDNELLSIIRFHDDKRIFCKRFKLCNNNFVEHTNIFCDDLVHHHNTYNSNINIETTRLEIPVSIKRKLEPDESNPLKKSNI